MDLRYSLSLVLIRNAYSRLTQILSKPALEQLDVEDINMLCRMIEEASESIRLSVTKEIIPDVKNKNLDKYL